MEGRPCGLLVRLKGFRAIRGLVARMIVWIRLAWNRRQLLPTRRMLFKSWDASWVYARQPSRRTRRQQLRQRTLTLLDIVLVHRVIHNKGQAFRERPADVAHFRPLPIHAHGTRVVQIVRLTARKGYRRSNAFCASSVPRAHDRLDSRRRPSHKDQSARSPFG